MRYLAYALLEIPGGAIPVHLQPILRDLIHPRKVVISNIYVITGKILVINIP